MPYYDLLGNALPGPKTRTPAQIRRACRSEADKKCRTPFTRPKEACEIRAAQYVAAMSGREMPHGLCLVTRNNHASWGVAPDGTKRVRAVSGVEIPNWDFTPEIISHSAE